MPSAAVMPDISREVVGDFSSPGRRCSRRSVRPRGAAAPSDPSREVCAAKPDGSASR
ncbi:Uncharacterised protein [Mycobacteroides abscessus subsp. abscessus]|nr:Uncharacterised protein [Mycobacteroides abscessus subsp. abscessus]